MEWEKILQQFGIQGAFYLFCAYCLVRCSPVVWKQVVIPWFQEWLKGRQAKRDQAQAQINVLLAIEDHFKRADSWDRRYLEEQVKQREELQRQARLQQGTREICEQIIQSLTTARPKRLSLPTTPTPPSPGGAS